MCVQQENQQRERQRQEQEREKELKYKRKHRELVGQGHKPFYLKKCKSIFIPFLEFLLCSDVFIAVKLLILLEKICWWMPHYCYLGFILASVCHLTMKHQISCIICYFFICNFFKTSLQPTWRSWNWQRSTASWKRVENWRTSWVRRGSATPPRIAKICPRSDKYESIMTCL